jgi:hypothetical protein
MKKYIIILVLAAVSFGCFEKPKFYSIDPNTGYFPKASTLPSDAVKVKEIFIEAKYKPMLYFRLIPSDIGEENFFVNSIRQMNYFQKVEIMPIIYRTKDGWIPPHSGQGVGVSIEELLAKNESWVKNKLPFLVVEVYKEFKGGFKQEMYVYLKAIDPETKDVVLDLHKQAPFLYMIETDFYSPLLNGFLEWVQGKEITVEKSNN